METNKRASDPHSIDPQVSHSIARLHAGILALVIGGLFGTGLFLMTIWLLLKGGENVGQHLGLLSQYLIGYSVSLSGAVIGFFYGILIGGVIGWTIGFIYNRVAERRHP